VLFKGIHPKRWKTEEYKALGPMLEKVPSEVCV